MSDSSVSESSSELLLELLLGLPEPLPELPAPAGSSSAQPALSSQEVSSSCSSAEMDSIPSEECSGCP